MNCKDLTTFLQKVLENKGMIYDPNDDQLGDVQKLIDEIEEIYVINEPYHYNFRVRLSREHNLSYVGEFHEGWAIAEPDINDHTSHYCFINMQGEFLRGEDGEILDFPLADRFSEGIAAVNTREEDYQRFIRTDGTFLNGFYKRTISSDIEKHRFVSGRALVQRKDGEEVYINSLCTLIHGTFDKPLTPFSNDGFAMVSAAYAWGEVEKFKSKGGDYLTLEDDSYKSISNFSEGYGIVGKTEDGGQNYDIRLVDTNGRFVRDGNGKIVSRYLDMRDRKIYPFHNGYATIVVGDSTFFFLDKAMNYSFADETGETVFYCTIGQHSFEDGLMPVRVKQEDGTENVRILKSDGKYLRFCEGEKKGEIIELDKNTGGFNEDGLARAYVEGYIFEQWIDRKGRVVLFGNGEHK